MKTFSRYQGIISAAIALTVLLSSCITTRYISDDESLKLQKSMQGKRTLNVLGDTFLTIGSVVVAAFTGIYFGYTPDRGILKKITLVNESPDTIQVNMLTDQYWKDSVYCDFKDIRIPPGDKCRLLVPLNSAYNLYFSNTIGNADDDELLEISTGGKSKIRLTPGMTLLNEIDSVQGSTVPQR